MGRLGCIHLPSPSVASPIPPKSVSPELPGWAASWTGNQWCLGSSSPLLHKWEPGGKARWEASCISVQPTGSQSKDVCSWTAGHVGFPLGHGGWATCGARPRQTATSKMCTSVFLGNLVIWKKWNSGINFIAINTKATKPWTCST